MYLKKRKAHPHRETGLGLNAPAAHQAMATEHLHNSSSRRAFRRQGGILKGATIHSYIDTFRTYINPSNLRCIALYCDNVPTLPCLARTYTLHAYMNELIHSWTRSYIRTVRCIVLCCGTLPHFIANQLIDSISLSWQTLLSIACMYARNCMQYMWVNVCM